MKDIGVLWDEEVSWDDDSPFGDDWKTNRNYEIYSNIASEKDMRLFLGHFSDYSNKALERAWFFDGEHWNKVNNIDLDGVYDKFKFDDEAIELKKEMLSELPVLNHFKLERICKDKYLTFEEFPEFVPETRKASRKSIKKMLSKYGKVLLKPGYDFGGRGIEVVESVEEAGEVDYSEDYVVQAFIDSSNGIDELDIEGMHDLRAIVINDEITELCVRQPGEGYLSNLSKGGTIDYLDPEDYPDSAKHILESVRERFGDFKPQIYTVDVIFDEENNPWILELNSKPGIGIFRGDEKAEEPPKSMYKVIEALNKL